LVCDSGLRQQGDGERSWMAFSHARIGPTRRIRRVRNHRLEDASQRYLARLEVVTVALA
jgi:hypothetical protein